MPALLPHRHEHCEANSLSISCVKRNSSSATANWAAQDMSDTTEAWALVNQCPVGISVVDNQGIIQFANRKAAEMLQSSPESVIGSPLGVPLTGGKPVEIDYRYTSGQTGTAEIRALPLRWQGMPAHLLTFHDVTERNLAEQALRHQAHHDGLTGLPNKEHFLRHVEQSIVRAKEVGSGFAILFLDLDDFKTINDTLGHAAGDELLRAIAERLRKSVRGTDLVSRMSGDEFTVLLGGINDTQTAMKVADELHERVFVRMEIAGQNVTPSGTMGISLFPVDGGDAESLLMRADTAMYHGKRSDRNRTHAFKATQGMAPSRRFHLTQALQRAQENEEFCVFYQPLLCVPGGKIDECEALLRWEDPELGLVSPSEFVPMLEETGLIHNVGDWVFREAAACIARCDRAQVPMRRVWVNIAARQLSDGEILNRLDQVTKETGVAPERIGIELTETSVIANIEQSKWVIHRLRERGFRVAMDDFGTGYSSLGLLRRLELDRLKIDRTFVDDMANSRMDRNIVRAVIAMARSMDLGVVAEGVETREQLDSLMAEECEYVQGYLLALPMPVEKLLQFLRTVDGSLLTEEHRRQ